MKIGIPKEIKNHEYRVGLTPWYVKDLIDDNNTVLVETGAGNGLHFYDEQYINAGAQIVDRDSVWNDSNLIVKIKEPLEEEYKYLREDLILFTYLHIASSKQLVERLLESKVFSIAYEVVQLKNGYLPLLAPMSEIAGKLSSYIASSLLMKQNGGIGKLMGGAIGVPPVTLTVLGAGIVGNAAINMAIGMGADVTVLDINQESLARIKSIHKSIKTLYCNPKNLYDQVINSDVLICAILSPGSVADKLITDEIVKNMKDGSVIIDVSIDQGGCCESSRPTTHSNPTFKKYNTLFYCVANIPGSVPYTSTLALNNSTYKYIKFLSKNYTFQSILDNNKELAYGIQTYNGLLCNIPVANHFKIKDILDLKLQ